MEQYKEKYPVLKDTVCIKKYPDFCWIMELGSDCNRSIAPMEAFLMANCTGEWNVSQIRYLVAGIWKMQPEEAEDIVHKTFSALHSCIVWRDMPCTPVRRYSAEDFLYIPSPGGLSDQERCDTPCEMFLALTNACNFRCIYCFNSSGENSRKEIGTEKWLQFIRQAGGLEVMKCTLTGGEPMLYEGFFDILEELEKQKIMPYPCTNGSLIDDTAISKFRHFGVRSLQISMDTADPEIHHKLTATQDTFGRVVKAIESLADADIEVNVKSVLTPYNLGHIEKFTALCSQIGVHRLTLDRYDVSMCGRGGSGLLITERQMEKVRDCILEYQKKSASEMIVEAVSQPKRWKKEKDIVFCGAFRRSLVVLPNGDVSVCEKLVDVPEMTVGNICDESLYDIWNSEKITRILSPEPELIDETCRNCEYLKQCGTGCFAIKYFLSKTPFSVDPRCWKAPREGNPYANL